jgi:amidase
LKAATPITERRSPETFLAYRDRTLTLTCISGLSRVPQVTIPVAKVQGAPVGLSLLARRGADLQLLGLIAELAPALLAA